MREEELIGEAVEAVVFENYGEENGGIIYKVAVEISQGFGTELDAETLLDAAMDMDTIGPDGILALMRAAVRYALENKS